DRLRAWAAHRGDIEYPCCRLRPGSMPGRKRQFERNTAMTLLYTDPLFLKHDTGQHPEKADRLRSITARLEKAGLVKKCTAGAYKPLSEDTVTRVHSAKQVMQIKQLVQHGGGRVDPDTVVSMDSL